jgi:thiamine biosynthesis lipoprotein
VALGAPPGEDGWPMAVGDPEGRTLEVLRLRDRALSRSGQDLGLHIFDPRTGRPAEGKLGAWSAAATGAEADALSTAFLVMSPAEVEAYCRAHPEHGALLLVEKDGKRELLRFGTLMT